MGADKAAQIHMVITNNTHEALSLVGATDSGTGSHWLAPVTRQSGTSLAGESRSRRGNHRLKNAMFLAAFAALRDPASKAFYDRRWSRRCPPPTGRQNCVDALL